VGSRYRYSWGQHITRKLVPLQTVPLPYQEASELGKTTLNPRPYQNYHQSGIHSSFPTRLLQFGRQKWRQTNPLRKQLTWKSTSLSVTTLRRNKNSRTWKENWKQNSKTFRWQYERSCPSWKNARHSEKLVKARRRRITELKNQTQKSPSPQRYSL